MELALIKQTALHSALYHIYYCAKLTLDILLMISALVSSLKSSHAAGAWGLAWYSKNTMVPLTVTGLCASRPRFRFTLSSIQR